MANERKASFEEHGNSFQKNLVKIILTDRPFADQMEEILNPNFLTIDYLGTFVELLKEYKREYDIHPSLEVFETNIKVKLRTASKEEKKAMLKFIAELKKEPIIPDTQYIKDESLDFCMKQNLRGAMSKCIDLLNTSSFESIRSVIDDALKLGSDNNFGYDYKLDFEKRFVENPRYPVSTGWKNFDAIIQGGIGEGELAVVIAPTGAGKSFCLVNLGAAALKAGKNVVYYTLELRDTVIGSRFDACLTGIKLDDLRKHKDKVLEKVKDIDARLIIKEYPTKTASTQTLRNHLHKLISNGFKPGYVLVDYGDILRPTGSHEATRHGLQSIYEELRAIAMEFGVPVVTASQTNRTGLNAEVITMESISEAYNKCFIADLIFSLSRTIKDKQNDEGRVYVAKNRNGEDGIIFPASIHWGYAKMLIHERTTLEEVQGDQEEELKSLKALLKEKYMNSR